MRKKIKTALIFLFLLIFGILGYQFYTTYQKKKEFTIMLSKLPEFSLSNTEGFLVTNKTLNPESWVVLVFFNSECHYCQEEAKQLAIICENALDIEFLWISSESLDTIRAFQNQYELRNNPNITFLQDKDGILTTYLGISSIPYFLTYDTDGKLFKSHKGALRIDELLEFIENGKETN